MNFDYSPKIIKLRESIEDFMQYHVYPAEAEYFQSVARRETHWSIPSVMEELKNKAQKENLWKKSE